MRASSCIPLFLALLIVFVSALSALADDAPRNAARDALAAAEACEQNCESLWKAALDAANAYAAQQATYATQDQDNTQEDANEASNAYEMAKEAAAALGDPALANEAKASMQAANAAVAAQSEQDYPGSADVEAAVQAVENGGPVDPALTQKIQEMCGVTAGIGAPGCGSWTIRIGQALTGQIEQAVNSGDVNKLNQIKAQCEQVGMTYCLQPNGEAYDWNGLGNEANRFSDGMQQCIANKDVSCIGDLINQCDSVSCPPAVRQQLEMGWFETYATYSCPANENPIDCVAQQKTECEKRYPGQCGSLDPIYDQAIADAQKSILGEAALCDTVECVEAIKDKYCSVTNPLCTQDLQDGLEARKDVITGLGGPQATPPPSTVCGQFPGYVNKAVECITWHLDNAALSLFGAFYPKFTKMVTAAMILAVVLYGVLLALGSGRFSEKEYFDGVGPQTIVLLLKMGVIFFFVVNYQTVYDWAIKGKEGLLGIVNASVNDVTYLSSDGGASVSFSACRTTQRVVAAGTEMVVPVYGKPDNIWKRLDCTIKRIVGFSTTQTEEGLKLDKNPNNMAMAGAIAGLLSALLFIPGIGIILFMTVVSFVLSLLLAVARSVHIFLVSHMAIILLLLFAPVVAPMLLFKVTRPYFDAWIRQLISYILQPVMLVAFLAMFAVALDMAVFAGDHSFYKTLFKGLPMETETSGSDEGKIMVPACGKSDKQELITTLQDAKCLDKNVYAKDFVSVELNKDDMGILKEGVIAGYNAIASMSTLLGRKQKTSSEIIESVFIDMPVEYLNIANCRKYVDDVTSGCGKKDDPPTPDQKREGMQTLLAVLANLVSMLLLVFVLSALLKQIPHISAEIAGGQTGQMPLENTISGLVRTGAAMMAKGVKG